MLRMISRQPPLCLSRVFCRQAGLTPVLAEALLDGGLLDPVSGETGFRVSEELMLILAKLLGHPTATVCI